MSGLSCLDSETFSCWVSLASFCFSLDQLSLIQPSKGPKSFLYLSSICFLLFLSKNNFDFIDSFLIFYLNRNPLPALVFELWRGWKSMFMLSLLFAQQPAIFLLTFWVCLSVNYLSICFSVEFLFCPTEFLDLGCLGFLVHSLLYIIMVATLDHMIKLCFQRFPGTAGCYYISVSL